MADDGKKSRVLFLCTHNSARSQMAEGLLGHLGGEKFEPFSAGTEATRVRPEAIEAMREIGVDISGQRSETLDRYLDEPFDYVVTVCDDANEACPVFPGAKVQLHWSLPDPSAVTGEGRMGTFREVRDRIRALIRPELLGAKGNLREKAEGAVLFLCTQNSARSQMAEWFLRHLAGGRFEVMSAGLDLTDEVHPCAVQAMAEVGIDISDQRPKRLGVYLGREFFNYLVIVWPAPRSDAPLPCRRGDAVLLDLRRPPLRRGPPLRLHAGAVPPGPGRDRDQGKGLAGEPGGGAGEAQGEPRAGTPRTPGRRAVVFP
jgi:arsenate reductase